MLATLKKLQSNFDSRGSSNNIINQININIYGTTIVLGNC